MSAAPHFHSELPREVSARLRKLYARSDWGRANLVTLNFKDSLPTPGLYEVAKTVLHEHERSILIMIGCVLPEKIHLLMRAGSLAPGRYKRFEEALRDIREATSASVGRALRSTGSIYADRTFIRPIDDEQDLMQIGFRVYKSPIVDELCSDPMRYPHLLLPPAF